jgi:amidohydrolase family protein
VRNSVGYYLRENVFVTSSGVFDLPVFDCARAMLGLDNLMFSVDHPFQDNFAAIEFLERCDLSPEDKERFAHGTADKLLKVADQPGGVVAANSTARDAWYRWSSRAKSKVGRTLITALVK